MSLLSSRPSTQLPLVIAEGLEFIQKEQQLDGSFLSWSSPVSKTFTPQKHYTTTFFTSLILEALTHFPPSITAPSSLLTMGIDFVLSQKSPDWTWNYWSRRSPEAESLPYPDDLDDTFAALSALHRLQPELLTGKVLAHVTMVLTHLEQQEGGPYITWVVPPTSPETWRDVDLAVNANVAYFLKLQDIVLPNLTQLFDQALTNNEYHSRYYPHQYPLFYFLGRVYQGQHSARLRAAIAKEKNAQGTWGTPVKTALATSALLALGEDPDVVRSAIEHLLDTQRQGGWAAEAFCLDPAHNGEQYVAGSTSLSTAMCLEALGRYLTAVETHEAHQAEQTFKKKTHKTYQHIMSEVSTHLQAPDRQFQDVSTQFLDKIINQDTDQQIALLPYFFSLSLGPRGQQLPTALITELGVANVLGWMAYTIYDDFLDEEGKPHLLGTANLCLRSLTHIFLNVLPAEAGFAAFFHQVMNQIDAANTWEVTTTRLSKKGRWYQVSARTVPTYTRLNRLAERSLGHALGPVALLMKLGHTPDSPMVVAWLKFAHHYLIARQLDDDAHDWREDLQRGHVNAVGSLTLKKYFKTRKHAVSHLALTNQKLTTLERLFWMEVIPDVCKLISSHLDQAHHALEGLSIIENRSLFEKLLLKISKSSEQALRDRQKTLDFVATYQT
ncbi:MAG TPA: hypothetical protein VD999_01430 [Vitreimonas sp.]|nr:hypothetical protein [Vitreimonas sp.]